MVEHPFEDVDRFDILAPQNLGKLQVEDRGEFASVVETQWGLRLPNGETAWGTWKSHDLTTTEGRQTLLQALKLTAADLGWPETDFVLQYGLVTRQATYTGQTITPLGE